MKACFLGLFFFFLTRSAFAQTCPQLLDKEGAQLYDCAGVHVLRLAGAPAARAQRMGELVKNGALSGEVLRYFGEKATEGVREHAGWLGTPLVLAYNQLIRLFHRNAPTLIAEEIDAMARGLGQDPIVLRRGLSLPDTGVFVQGLGSYPGLHFLPAVGCTSVAAQLKDGGFAYARNLDFAGVGVWDRHPMLLAIEPESGSRELRHLVIGADGLPFGGITGVNEAGITLAVHQNYSRDISISGVPMALIGELVLREAKTVDEAIDALRRYRPASLWTFVLTDLKNGDAAAVESSSTVFLTRRRQGKYFVQTNHAMHAESRGSENSPFGVEANSLFRMEQAFRMLESEPPTGAGDLAKILAYQEDPLGQLSAYHDVLKSETIQTVLFEARPGGEPTLAVSIDPAPASSGRYAEIPLAQFWKPDAPEWQPRDFLHTPDDKRHRQLTIADAHVRYFDRHEYAEAAALLASQRTLDAALFRCVAMAAAGRYADSLRLAEEALRDPRYTGEPVYIRESLIRVRLVSLFRLGRGSEARALADSVVEETSRGKAGPSKQKLAEIARRILNHESVPEWMLALHFDFFSGDLSGRKD